LRADPAPVTAAQTLAIKHPHQSIIVTPSHDRQLMTQLGSIDGASGKARINIVAQRADLVAQGSQTVASLFNNIVMSAADGLSVQSGKVGLVAYGEAQKAAGRLSFGQRVAVDLQSWASRQGLQREPDLCGA